MDAGTVSRNADLRLSYLQQHDPFKLDETVIGFLERYSGKEEWECAELAGRFHLKYDWLEKKMSELPGGYRTRVKLTSMLLSNPNFLVLDEPTNYLDLSTLILLETFLADFNGGYLIVSHDREFLKRTCEHTLEIEHGKLSLYPGNIEDYFEQKEELLRQKMAYNKTVEKKREQMQEFIDRFKAKASTASRAKSKVKQMQKLKTIEIAHPMGSVNIRIPEIEKKGGLALACQDLKIGYPDRTVAENVTVEFDRGARVAILGDNGQGKTTFLRTVSGTLPVLGGSFRWGTGLKVAYYAQHVFSALHPKDDVLSYLQREAAEGTTLQDVLNMAGSFLFSGNDVEKKASVLSGGERARLVLAGILLSRNHVLILDEPTNHLDFETVEALAGALRSYNGSVFFTSHDRTFVNLIATNILDIKDGKITRYPGTYEDYCYHLECEARGEDEDDSISRRSDNRSRAVGEQDGADGESAADAQKAAGEAAIVKARETKKQLDEIKKKIKKSESRIQYLNTERDRLLEDIKKNPFNYSRDRNEKLKEVTAQHEREEKDLAELKEEQDSLNGPAGPSA